MHLANNFTLGTAQYTKIDFFIGTEKFSRPTFATPILNKSIIYCKKYFSFRMCIFFFC
jgi:hypothetical protein